MTGEWLVMDILEKVGEWNSSAGNVCWIMTENDCHLEKRILLTSRGHKLGCIEYENRRVSSGDGTHRG